MVFGTVVGSLGDRFGRKSASLLYVLMYIASCVTKHWSNYEVCSYFFYRSSKYVGQAPKPPLHVS